MEQDETDVESVQRGKKGKRRKEANIDPPTRGEVEYHIQKTKNNKAPGEDNIAAELIKHGGAALVDAMYKLIRMIWETKNAGKMAIRDHLSCIQKGRKLECGNYRGITLLRAAYTILTSIINDRVQKVIKKITGEYQCGFRPNKGTRDQLLIIRQMTEKNCEHGSDLHMLFVDFEQAFDSVNRRKLSEAMEEVGIQQKLITLIEMTLKDTKAVVKINNWKPRTFGFNTGVKKGQRLSTTLFIIALHKVIREIDQRGTILNKLSQISAHADDVV
jgi:hypothetical protein